MPLIITQERPDTTEAMLLIDELTAALEPFYPPESRHGYSAEKLVRENVAFFVARYDGEPAGCGGVLLAGSEYAEVKRMYVRPQYRGRGIAGQILNHLEGYSRAHGLTVMRLETGIYQTEAIGLYQKLGYKRISPFGAYRDDPVSMCFEKRLE
ncbi:MAG: N-acetyltransferase GCN5 [Chloroflexi bacterium OLB15]|nr:MAG: N-acetyltransferase GCN5 [Chloroflexi bacterium OLB15]